MNSKFIPKSRINKQSQNWFDILGKDYWQSKPISKEEIEQEKKHKEESNYLKLEKQRIESITLEDLSFKDLYQFPFHQAKFGSRVYDKNSNFIFQFLSHNEETNKKCIEILNGNIKVEKENKIEHKHGEIFVNDKPYILIRGWGNLTGIGAYNLDGEYAGKIQDTLAEFIVEKLNHNLTLK